jgi:ParB-like chromosome segregation protein Spo0J
MSELQLTNTADPAQWPAFNIERRSVKSLKLNKGNARTHTPEQVKQIAASIKEWGWTQPVLVDEGGMVVAGHGRLMAAKQLGIKEVPTITAKGWSPAQVRAYALADNQLALNSEWDFDLLKVELAELTNEGFDISLAGFPDLGFAPVIEPDTIGPAAVTAEDLQKAGDDLQQSINGAAKQDLARVLCPNCDHIFTIDKAQLA